MTDDQPKHLDPAERNAHYAAAQSLLEENRRLIVGGCPDLIEVLAFAQVEATLALVDIMVDLTTVQASTPVRARGGVGSLTEQAQRLLGEQRAAARRAANPDV